MEGGPWETREKEDWGEMAKRNPGSSVGWYPGAPAECRIHAVRDFAACGSTGRQHKPLRVESLGDGLKNRYSAKRARNVGERGGTLDAPRRTEQVPPGRGARGRFARDTWPNRSSFLTAKFQK